MTQLRPFRALRATDKYAAEVIELPYDVMNEAEARAIFARNARSFIRVSRPETQLPEGADSHSAAAYDAAAQQLSAMRAEGLLCQDETPCLYLYGQKMGEHRQVCLVANFSVREYDQNLIKKHEFTRPDKEKDRIDHIEATHCQSGLVFLAYRDHAPLQALLVAEEAQSPLWRVTTRDNVEHTLWRIAEPARIQAIQQAAEALPCTYIADGHHRSAAASLVHKRSHEQESHAWFVAGLFPASSLQILSYNRAVKDLNGHSTETLLQAIRDHFDCQETSSIYPETSGVCTMYLEGRWYRLEARDIPSDPVESLDVSLLQNNILRPLLGIDDPRTNKRIDFVGGIRGPEELVRLVDSKSHAVAFHMHPTAMSQLLAVADAGKVMPPKSTWFEPKLRDAVVMHLFE